MLKSAPMTARLIDETERNDFVDGVKSLGYKVTDFVVTAGPRVEVRLEPDRYILRQEVTVLRRSTKTLRAYQGGHGYAWASAAVYDIENGAFGAKQDPGLRLLFRKVCGAFHRTPLG
jgi:hypothetical protein